MTKYSQSDIEALTGQIKIYRDRKNTTHHLLTSYNKFFGLNKSIVLKFDGYKMVIARAALEDRKTFTPSRISKWNYHSVSFVRDPQIPAGTYLIDTEESNEDQLVIYFDSLISG